MGRAPCCEKEGMKKGLWTLEEDQILINFISLHGHQNWRTLPKQAGLQRCGKSCRLRWINYLRPDIKRGNFTREEDDTIINLHQMLGNRWSEIAARLPGRTDNEIKNVWHTRLKKRLKNKQQQATEESSVSQETQPVTSTARGISDSTCHHVPPSRTGRNNEDKSSSSISNEDIVTTSSCDKNEFIQIDEGFWPEGSNNPSISAFEAAETAPLLLPLSPLLSYGMGENGGLVDDGDGNGMEYWYEVFDKSEELTVPKMC